MITRKVVRLRGQVTPVPYVISCYMTAGAQTWHGGYRYLARWVQERREV